MAAPLLHAREGLKPTVVGKPEQILMQAIKEKSARPPPPPSRPLTPESRW